MMNGTMAQFEVDIPIREVRWFAKNRRYPLDVDLDTLHRTVRYADREFVYYPLGGDRFVVTRKQSTIPLGVISPETIRQALSDDVARDLRVVRAAVLQRDYEVPIALRLTNSQLVHPGECWEAYQKREKVLLVERVLHVVKDEDLRCVVCEEGF